MSGWNPPPPWSWGPGQPPPGSSPWGGRPPTAADVKPYPSSQAYPSQPACPSWNPPPWSWAPPSHCYGSFNWVQSWGGNVPPGAVHAGQDLDGGPIYVGRAYHQGDLLPAKICPSHRCAFVSHGGRQVEEHTYEVLVSDHVAWRWARNGEVPSEAIRVGHTVSGESLYMGRTMFEGTMTPGKVHPSHGCLYIAWSGEELKFHEYEIMVLN
ncbi:Protein of unknown function (DUF3421) [Nesidiocoris tenuis]|uniref:Uncharacterized protein n=1 Tax=Nesidiocoris tenuis TaxID=355587 RepID=A0ABN7B0U6_9HEMI|nr:Protein of unknown function (DUF3421) [Nesidiocoris tenuis]